MLKKVPGPYVAMMALTGATIGAITALSQTSVTNTLIEVVLVFISGSAGLYYLNRKSLQEEGEAIRAIGAVGVIFLASFWAALLILRLGWPDQPDYAPWSDERNLAENLGRAELRGHLRGLGVDPAAAERLGPAVELLPPAAAGSCLAEGDARAFVALAAETFRDLRGANCVQDSTGRAAVTMLAAEFDVLRAMDVGPEGAARPQFNGAAAALLALAGVSRAVAAPHRIANCTLETGPAAAAGRLAARIAACREDPATQALHLARSHAEAFRVIWGTAVEVPTERLDIVLEGIRNAQN